jgi:hypothetical protein
MAGEEILIKQNLRLVGLKANTPILFSRNFSGRDKSSGYSPKFGREGWLVAADFQSAGIEKSGKLLQKFC